MTTVELVVLVCYLVGVVAYPLFVFVVARDVWTNDGWDSFCYTRRYAVKLSILTAPLWPFVLIIIVWDTMHQKITEWLNG